MRSAAIVLLTLPFVFCATPCFAKHGPPYFTDDPEPADYLSWEVYVAWQYLRTAGMSSSNIPWIEANFGGLKNVHFHIGGPLSTAQSTGQKATLGYGDTELGFKYRFQEQTKTKPSIAIFPAVQIPTGAASRGLGGGTTSLYIPVWFEKTFGRWNVNAGGGYWRLPSASSHDYWFIGSQVDFKLTEKLTIGGEVYETTPASPTDPYHFSVNLGAIYDVDESHHVLFAIGKDVRGGTRQTLYLGYQWQFKRRTPEKLD